MQRRYKDGYKNGYVDGYIDGHTDGHIDGYIDWYRDGYKDTPLAVPPGCVRAAQRVDAIRQLAEAARPITPCND